MAGRPRNQPHIITILLASSNLYVCLSTALKLRLLRDEAVAFGIAFQSVSGHFSHVSESSREHGDVKLGQKTFHDVLYTFFAHDTAQVKISSLRLDGYRNSESKNSPEAVNPHPAHPDKFGSQTKGFDDI